MTYEAIISDLEQGRFQPVYILHGEEGFYIDRIAEYIRSHALNEAEKAFNLHIVYGKDIDSRTLLDLLMRYPMGAPRQVVILREAQQMRTLDKLETYLEKPTPSTVFVICYKHKKLDKRTRFAKLAAKHAVEFYAAPLRDYQVPDWIMRYTAESGIRISEKAAALLEEYLGSNLDQIANSLDKIIANLEDGQTIEPEHIEKYIGISRQYNPFELLNAIAARKPEKAFRIIRYFGANPRATHINVVLATLYGFFSKLFALHYAAPMNDKQMASYLGVHPFFVRQYKSALKVYDKRKTVQAIRLLGEYDLRSKGIGNGSAGQEALMQELAYKLMHL